MTDTMKRMETVMRLWRNNRGQELPLGWVPDLAAHLTRAGFVSVEDAEDALADLMHEDADVHKLFKAKLRALVEVSP